MGLDSDSDSDSESDRAPLEYNTLSPPSLFVPGLLQGHPIGVHSTTLRVTRQRILVGQLYNNHTIKAVQERGGENNLVALKVVEDDNIRQPRNPKREVQLLGSVNHPNVLCLLNAYLLPPSSPLFPPAYYTFTPYYPLSLLSLLSSPSLPLHPHFHLLSHSLAYQMITAVAYLHEQGIAHRDIAPANFVLSRRGRIVLIDLGISVMRDDEEEGSMAFEIGTGSYRPPEILFASKSYDIFAIDLWSLACTIAESFTGFEVREREEEEGEGDGEEEEGEKKKTLFDGTRGEFGLIGSIFKVLGTPTLDTWPEASHLPNFSRVQFVSFPPTPLASHLPHLLPESDLLRVLHGMLRMSAGERMSARVALEMLEGMEREEQGERLRDVLQGFVDS